MRLGEEPTKNIVREGSQHSWCFPWVPKKNLVLHTRLSWQAHNYSVCTELRAQSRRPYSHKSDTYKLSLGLFGSACVSGPQTCPQISVSDLTGSGLRFFYSKVESTPTPAGNGSIDHGGLTHCKWLDLVYYLPFLLLYHLSLGCMLFVLYDLKLFSGLLPVWYLSAFWPWFHPCYILSCDTAWPPNEAIFWKEMTVAWSWWQWGRW